MVITNGNDVGAAAPAQVVQAGPSAADLVAALKEAGLVGQPQQQQQAPVAKPSRFDQLMEQAKANEDSEPAVVSFWESLGKALKQDIEEGLSGKTVSPEVIIQERSEAALEYVNEQLEEFFEDEEDGDKLITVARALLMEEIQQKKYDELKEKIARGSREKKALKELVQTHAAAVKKMVGRSGERKEGKGVSGVADGAGAANAKASKPDAGETSLDSLSDAQMDWYSSRRRNCISAGMSAEEAHKNALASALRTPK